jgi:hypothetical protein
MVNYFMNGSIRSLPSSDDSKITTLLRDSDIESNKLSKWYIDYYKYYQFSALHMSLDVNATLFIANAGGKSEISEAISMHYMQSFFGATNVIPEMAIKYRKKYAMCDYIITIFGHQVGVSVTRAFKPKVSPVQFTEMEATRLIFKKLNGLVIARNCVDDQFSFFKSILHVWCPNVNNANILHAAYNKLMLNEEFANTISNVLILTTVCNNDSLYSNTFC